MADNLLTPRTPEQAAEERDRQWLANVYRGDNEPDLTVRAVLAGMAFGGLMSLSNLYVGLKMGWGLGVDLVAVIVIFAVFKALCGIGLVRREFGLMENTMMMSVAVAASWMSSAGLVSAVPALTMLTGYKFVPWQLMLLIGVILYLGLFMAIPLKRQMIQVDSLRFPSNVPTGETLRVIYSHGSEALKKAATLGLCGVLGMIVAGLRDGLKVIPGQFQLPWRIKGISFAKLTLSLEPSLIFISIGALFGLKVGLSMLLGLVVNYGFLAPNLIHAKAIHHPSPKITAINPPSKPLAIGVGTVFVVKLEVADAHPELPSDKELKANPELASEVATQELRYTWTRGKTYTRMEDLIDDLNAVTLDDGKPNPLHDVIHFGVENEKNLGAIGGAVSENFTLGKFLVLEAPKAIDWEARLSIPKFENAVLLRSLGLKLPAGASKADVEEADAAMNEKAMQKIGGFRNISAWSLWPGATVLVVGGLLALAFQWRSLGRTFASIFAGLSGKKKAARGPLDHIEIPMTWFVVGFVVTGACAVVLLTFVFDIHWWMGVVAVLLTFFLAAVVARAGAETGINPIGAMGKVTQLTYGLIAPGNIAANLMTANVTAGAACSCSDTVGNLKVGHMVGANPRRQFISQFFGVLAGAVLAVPAYFILVPDANALGGEKFPAPSALVWKGVAEVLSKGLSTLPPSVLWAMGTAFVLGIIIVVIDNVFPKARPFTPSPAALGIALTSPAYQAFPMFLGALIAWVLERHAKRWHEMYTIPIASGCIAGESIMGVILAALVAAGLMQ